MPTTTRGALLVAVLAATLLSACGARLVQDVQDLLPLRERLVATYHTEDVRLVVQNGNALGISFVNTPFNELPAADKAATARAIAQFAAANYASIDHIDHLWVAFVVHRQYVVVSYTNSLDTYFFEKDELTGVGRTKQSKTQP